MTACLRTLILLAVLTACAATSGAEVIDAAKGPYWVRCDGSTDDTTRLQAAPDAIVPGRNTVLLPAGLCVHTGLVIAETTNHWEITLETD